MERSEWHTQGVGDKKWVLEMDGSSWDQGGGVGIVLRTPGGLTIAQAIKLAFIVFNNEALILGLRVAKCLSIENIELWCDSQLVASQL